MKELKKGNWEWADSDHGSHLPESAEKTILRGSGVLERHGAGEHQFLTDRGKRAGRAHGTVSVANAFARREFALARINPLLPITDFLAATTLNCHLFTSAFRDWTRVPLA